MPVVTTKPSMKTVKKEKIVLHMMHAKRNLGQEKKIQKLLADVLKTIE